LAQAEVVQIKQAKPKRLYQKLYFQVIVAITLGVLLGHFYPDLGARMKPLGDGFVKLIKMIIAPIIFLTVAVGIAKLGDAKEIGRVAIKSLIYFEVVTTLALAIGLVVVNVLQPGAGINATANALDPKSLAEYTAKAKPLSTVEFILNIIPSSVVDAFAKGDTLQVLFFSILFGLGLIHFKAKGQPLLNLLDELSHVLFGIVGMIMKFAPLGAFGAMAFTIGQHGVGSLVSLGKLLSAVYLTCILFIAVVLGLIARMAGFSLWKFLKYIKEEIVLVVGTSSSESALPRMMSKLQNLGCARPVVGFCIPMGYSFNQDGSSIYLTMAAIFVAQAMNVPLTLGDQLTILGVMLLTSKGTAAVTGGGFITLTATLASLGKIPVEGVALLLGVDRFMSEARSLTNLIGNGVATVVIAKWEKALDVNRMRQVLNQETDMDADEPEEVVDALQPVAPIFVVNSH
jgi:aerobic C4-dicarboxylate transport protein